MRVTESQAIQPAKGADSQELWDEASVPQPPGSQQGHRRTLQGHLQRGQDGGENTEGDEPCFFPTCLQRPKHVFAVSELMPPCCNKLF